MTISDNVHRLTRQHLTTQGGRTVTVPSLLDQLTTAIHPSQAGGKTGSAAAKIPIDAGAMSLWQDIEREAREYQHELIGADAGKLTAIMQSWAMSLPTPEWATFLDHVTLDWCDRITNLLEPARPYRPNTACPHCETKYHGAERTQALAVYFRDTSGNTLHPEQWRMECANCGVQWAGDSLGTIAHAMSQ